MKTNAKIAAVAVAVLTLGVPLLARQFSHGEAVRPTLSPVAPSPATPGCTSATRPRPRFVDLGTTTCAPCRAMLAVMDDLRQRYPDSLEVQFVNVQEDHEALARYGVDVIPTQIFYSPEGRELVRHVGVFPADAVVAQWRTLGYDLAAPSNRCAQ